LPEEDQAALDSLSLLGIAWHQDRAENQDKRFNAEEYKAFLAQLVDLVPSLRQQRPEEPPPLPKIWRDEITGESARNPWSNPPDLDSQGAVMERDPELASWLKKAANGVSYKLLAEQRAQVEARLRRSSIRYSKPEHQTNPWRQDNLQKRADFLKTHGQEAGDYFAKEAEPIKLPWAIGSQNHTATGQIVKQAPHIAKLVFRSSELYRQRLTAEAASLQRQEEEAQRRRLDLEKKLRSK
jgi:hypothetical protein